MIVSGWFDNKLKGIVYEIATNTIYHGKEYTSKIILPIEK